MTKSILVFIVFILLIFSIQTAISQEAETTDDDADILGALEDDEESLAAFEDSGGPLSGVLGPKIEMTGFVDFGWIDPGFLADTPTNSDHYYAESSNAQNMLTKLEARTFSLNEVDFGLKISYNDHISGRFSISSYPTTRNNVLGDYSAIHRDQDIPRDTGPDGEFGTPDDVIGADTAVDPGNGENKVLFGVRQAYIDLAYPGDFNAFLRIGKMPSLLGIEQEIFRAPDIPTVAPSAIGPYSYGYPQGMQLRGFLSLVSDDDLEFGLGMTHDANNRMGAFPADVERNLPFALADDNLIFAGRLAYSYGVRNRFTLGVSGQTGRKGSEAQKNDGRLSSFHPFAKVRLDPFNNPNIGPFHIRAEYLFMDVENRIGSDPNQSSGKTEKYDYLFTPIVDTARKKNRDGDAQIDGFYIYLSVDLIKKLTLTVGYSRVDNDVVESLNPELAAQGRFLAFGFQRTQVAARYQIHDYIAVKAEFQKNREDFGLHGGDELDNDILTTSFVFSF